MDKQLIVRAMRIETGSHIEAEFMAEQLVWFYAHAFWRDRICTQFLGSFSESQVKRLVRKYHLCLCSPKKVNSHG